MDISENLSRYKIFLCVAQCLSISKASEQLYISQPAVSSCIKKLEESLGVTLFIRKARGVILTENGKILYQSVKQALGTLTDTEKNLMNAKSAGRLRIAASNVLCKYMLMPYLKQFTEKYPEVDLSIVCTSSDKAFALLEEHAIDVALAAKPSDTSCFSYTTIGAIEDIFVCSPNYFEKILDDVFETGKVMLLNKNNVSRMHVDNYFAENGIVPSHVLEVNDMNLLIEFSKIGIGVSCVVKQFVEKELSEGSLREIKLKKAIPPREAGFLYNSEIKPFNENILKLISL